MKKIILTMLFTIGIMVLPIKAHAIDLSEYETLNLEQVLEKEEIEKTFKKYSENSKQIPIYLFRGDGCHFCQNFITFLDSIADEYKEYFRLVSFEVWQDSKNNELMKKTAEFLNKDVGGVPFIVIGDEVFQGYISDFDDSIKNAIKKEYNNKEHYDVFVEMEKAKDESAENNTNSNTLAIVLWTCGFTIIALTTNLIYTKKQVKKLEENLISEIKKIKKI